MVLHLLSSKSDQIMANSSSGPKSEVYVEHHNYNINDLPNSLLVEILLRVPTCKSAQQCKSVCKRWHSLISNPYFIRRFISHHHDASHSRPVSQPLTLLHQYRYYANHDKEPNINNAAITVHPVHTKVDAVTDHSVLRSRTSFELDFLPFYQTADIVASHEDLVICYDRKLSFELLRQGKGTTFYICNILTKEWLLLPPAPSSYWRSGLVGFVPYVADPCKIKVREAKPEYKLIHIPKAKELSAEIFSSETGEWSKSVIPSSHRFDLQEKCITNATTFRQKVHWIINDNRVLVFDPFGSDNQTRIIDLPILAMDGEISEIDCIGVCEGQLHVSQFVRSDGSYRVIIWDLKDYDAGEWCLKHNVCLNEMDGITDNKLETGDVACLLAFHPTEISVLYLRYKNQVLLCNMQERTLQVISECNRSWTRRLRNERDTAFILLHPCWPSSVQPS